MGLRVHRPTHARLRSAVPAYGPESVVKLSEHRRTTVARANASASHQAVPPAKLDSPIDPQGEGPVDDLPRLLSMVRTFPLLSNEMSVDCAKRVSAGTEAAQRLSQAHSRASQNKLKQLVSSGLAAKELLVSHNLRLVLAIARQFGWSCLPLADRFQHGVLGLVRAVEKYDYRLGYRFSTYATWWIRQSITRGIQQEDSVIRVPVHVREQIAKLSKLERSRPHQEEASDAVWLAARLEWNASQVAEVQLARTRAAVELLDPAHLTKTLDIAVQEPDVAECVTGAIFVGLAVSEIGRLPERERRILVLRYGLHGGHEWTLEEIGQEVGLTRERVRQLVASSLEQLQRSLSSTMDCISLGLRPTVQAVSKNASEITASGAVIPRSSS